MPRLRHRLHPDCGTLRAMQIARGVGGEKAGARVGDECVGVPREMSGANGAVLGGESGCGALHVPLWLATSPSSQLPPESLRHTRQECTACMCHWPPPPQAVILTALKSAARKVVRHGVVSGRHDLFWSRDEFSFTSSPPFIHHALSAPDGRTNRDWSGETPNHPCQARTPNLLPLH